MSDGVGESKKNQAHNSHNPKVNPSHVIFSTSTVSEHTANFPFAFLCVSIKHPKLSYSPHSHTARRCHHIRLYWYCKDEFPRSFPKPAVRAPTSHHCLRSFDHMSKALVLGRICIIDRSHTTSQPLHHRHRDTLADRVVRIDNGLGGTNRGL